MKTIILVLVIVLAGRVFGQGNEALISIPNSPVVYVLSEHGMLERLSGSGSDTIHVNFEYSTYADWIHLEETRGRLFLKWLKEYESRIAQNPANRIDSLTLLWSYNYSMISFRKDGDIHELMATYSSREETVSSPFGLPPDIGKLVNLIRPYQEEDIDGMQVLQQTQSILVWRCEVDEELVPFITIVSNEGDINLDPYALRDSVQDILTVYADDAFVYTYAESSDSRSVIRKYDQQLHHIGDIIDWNTGDEQELVIPAMNNYYFRVNQQTVRLYSISGTLLITTPLTGTPGIWERFKQLNTTGTPVWVYPGTNNYHLAGLGNMVITLTPNALNTEFTPFIYSFNSVFYGRAAMIGQSFQFENPRMDLFLMNNSARYENIGSILLSDIDRVGFLPILATDLPVDSLVRYYNMVADTPDDPELKTVSGNVRNLPKLYQNVQLTGRLLETVYTDNNPSEVYEVLTFPGVFSPVIATREHFLVMPRSDTVLYRLPRVIGEGLCIEQYIASSIDRLNEDKEDIVEADDLVESDGVLRVNYARSGTVLFAHANGITRELKPYPATLIPENPNPLAKGMLRLNLDSMELHEQLGRLFGLAYYTLTELTEMELKDIFRYPYSLSMDISRRVVDDLITEGDLYAARTEVFRSGIDNGLIVSLPGKMQHAYWQGFAPEPMRISSQDFSALKERTGYWMDLFDAFGNRTESDLNLLPIGALTVLTNLDSCYLWVREDGSPSFEPLGAFYSRTIHDDFQRNFGAFFLENGYIAPYDNVVRSPDCTNQHWLAVHYQNTSDFLISSRDNKVLHIINFPAYATDCAVWETAFRHDQMLRAPRTLSKRGDVVYSYAPGQSIFRLSESADQMGRYDGNTTPSLLEALFDELEYVRTWKKKEVITSMKQVNSEAGEMLQVTMSHAGAKEQDVLFFEGETAVKRIFLLSGSYLPEHPEVLKQLSSYRPVNTNYIWEIFPLNTGCFALSGDTLHQLSVNSTETRMLGKIEVPRAYPKLVQHFFNDLSDEANANPGFRIEDNFCLCNDDTRYPSTVTRFGGSVRDYRVITQVDPGQEPVEYLLHDGPIHLPKKQQREFSGAMIRALAGSNTTRSNTYHTTDPESIVSRIDRTFYHWVPAQPTQRRLFDLIGMHLEELDETALIAYLDTSLLRTPAGTFEHREYLLTDGGDTIPTLLLREQTNAVFAGFQRNQTIRSHRSYHTLGLDTLKNLSHDYWNWLGRNYEVVGNRYSFHSEFSDVPFILAPKELIRFDRRDDYAAVYFEFERNQVDSADVQAMGTTFLKKLVKLDIAPGRMVDLYAAGNKGFAVVDGNYFYVQHSCPTAPNWSSQRRDLGFFKERIEDALLPPQTIPSSVAKEFLKRYWRLYFNGTLANDNVQQLDFGGRTFTLRHPIHSVLYGN